MAKNVKALSDEDLAYIVKNYTFELLKNYIVVSKNGYGMKTIHDINKSFFIKIPTRRVNITKHAIELWINKFMNTYSLIEVQAAINKLIVTYQDLNVSDIEREIISSKRKINNLN